MVGNPGMRLPPLPTIKEIIRLYRLRAKKQLSQNFLLDRNLTDKIVRSAGKLDGCHVCEVGPGPGGITRSVLEAGAKDVVLIEKDSRFMPGLELLNEASGGRVRIYHGDALQFNMNGLFPEEIIKSWDDEPPKVHVLGNLPFSVSTPLIINYLEHISNRTSLWQYGRVGLTLTFQKEVAERMVADVLDKQRSRLSIMSQYLCKVKHKFTIPGKCFVPAPDVDVGVVTFIPRKRPLINTSFRVVEKVVRHVFHFRQKKCKRGIETLFPPDLAGLGDEMFNMAEVVPDARPYQLSVGEFDRLCQAYQHLCQLNPGLLEFNYRSQESLLVWENRKMLREARDCDRTAEARS